MTIAPALAAMGLVSRLTEAGVLDRTICTSANASGTDRLDGIFFPLELDRFARAPLRGQEFDASQGEIAARRALAA